MPQAIETVVDIVILKCKEEWDECQKKQLCSKAKSLNAEAKNKGSLNRRPVTPRLADAKETWQAKYKRDCKSGKTQPDYADDCAKTNGKRLDADHVVDVQLGGLVKGPFQFLDASVNSSVGSTIRNSTVNPCKGFKTSCIPPCPL